MTYSNVTRVERVQTREYRLFVNDAQTIYVRMWSSGRVEVATREHRDDIWGPPVELEEES